MSDWPSKPLDERSEPHDEHCSRYSEACECDLRIPLQRENKRLREALMGFEQVRNAARQIQSAADRMQSAASGFNFSVNRLEQMLQRLETLTWEVLARLPDSASATKESSRGD